MSKLRTKSNGGMKTKLAVMIASVALTGTSVFGPFAAFAQTTDIVAQLQAQIAALQAQLTAMMGNSGTQHMPGSFVSCTFTRNLTVGVTGADVKCLQQYLNSAGFKVSASGVGSPGMESTYFGNLTKMAAAKWQKAYNVSPPAGYFGSISRAKYSALWTAAQTPSGTPTPPSTPPSPSTPPGATPAPAPMGSGVTVSPATQSPSTLAPANASRVPFAKAIFTASADGDVTINGVTVERQGLADDAVFSSIILIDQDGMQIGSSRSLNANHQVILNDQFTVKAGQSRTITIAGNMASSLTSYNGQIAKLALVGVTTTGSSTKVNGTFPIVGNDMTINGNLTIGSLTSPTRGTLDPGAARTSLDVNAMGFYTTGVKWSVGSGEPVTVEQIRFYQAGSVAASDIKNVMVTVKGVDYPTTLSSDGKYYNAMLGSGIDFDKGATVDVGIKLDVNGGSNRTINLDLQKRTDVVVKGKTFGYYLTPDNGSSVATADTGAFSSSQPYYDAFAHTISVGTLRVEKSISVPAGNIGAQAANTPLGAFSVEAKGEAVQVTSFALNFTFSGTGTGSDVTSVSIVDENGKVVAGPKDISSGLITFTDSWTIPTGVHVYTVKGKLGTTFVSNDTIAVGVLPSGITAKGDNTGLTITPTPASQVTANTQTVKTGGLKISVSPTPSSQNVVRGVNGFLFAKIQYDAGDSGEDIRITAQTLALDPSSTAQPNDINSCVMFDGTTALNTGSNVLSPTGTTADTEVALAFTLDNNLIVPKGTVKVVDVKCNISTAPTAGESYQIGLSSTNNSTTAVGKDTGATASKTTTNSTGSTMTIQTGGSLTYSLDVSSPTTERYGIAGKTDNLLGVIKFHATYEPIVLNRIALTLSSSTASTSDVTKVTLWDGTTKVGEAIFGGTNTLATSTLTSSVTIPADTDKLITIKADLMTLNINNQASRGHLVSVNMYGDNSTTRGTGQSSGATINPTNGVDTTGVGVRLVKSYPTLERLTIPTNTLANGEISLYRFKVTADAAGDVGLAVMTFRVSSTTVATTSVFKLYAYADLAFSVNAYAQNPPHSNNPAVVSRSVWTASGDNYGAVASSSNQIVFYFNPSATTIAGTVSSTTPQTYEALNVPAGTSRYFELKGTVANSAAGDSISVALVGDNANGVNTNLVNRSIANVVDGVSAAAGNFIWSPNTTTTSATSSNDWINGYQLPGLPGTEMTQQTLSK